MNKSLIYNEKANFSIKAVYLLAVLILAYGLNDYLNFVLIIGFMFVFIKYIKDNVFYLFYFALVFYDSVLVLPLGMGSVYRIYQIFIFVRILIDLREAKYIKLTKSRVFIACVLLLWALSVVSNESNTFFSMVVNVIILIYIFGRIEILPEKLMMRSKMLYVLGLFSLLSGIYGLYNGRIINVLSGKGDYTRLSGTVADPNYSAMFYLIGFFALLGTSEIKNKKIKNFLLIVIAILVISTVSMTGILCMVVLYTFYSMISNPKKLLLKVIFMISAIYTIPNLLSNNTYIIAIKNRVQFIYSGFLEGDYESITSSRTRLVSDYFEYFLNLPYKNIFFGGFNLVTGEDRDFMVSTFGHISHNTYIDLLFALGFIGTFIIVSYFLLRIFKLSIRYLETNYKEYISIAFIKLVILWFSMGLSMFPYRYFIMILFM